MYFFVMWMTFCMDISVLYMEKEPPCCAILPQTGTALIIQFLPYYNDINLKNIDMLSGKCFIHASYRTEFTTHGAGILMFRFTVIPDTFSCFRIHSAFPLRFPVKLSSGICHLIVDLTGSADTFAMSAACAAILEAMIPCFTSSRFGSARCSAGVT